MKSNSIVLSKKIFNKLGKKKSFTRIKKIAFKKKPRLDLNQYNLNLQFKTLPLCYLVFSSTYKDIYLYKTNKRVN